jgi:hypothetical protein
MTEIQTSHCYVSYPAGWFLGIAVLKIPMNIYPEDLSYHIITIREASSFRHSLINQCCQSISLVALFNVEFHLTPKFVLICTFPDSHTPNM